MPVKTLRQLLDPMIGMDANAFTPPLREFLGAYTEQRGQRMYVDSPLYSMLLGVRGGWLVLPTVVLHIYGMDSSCLWRSRPSGGCEPLYAALLHNQSTAWRIQGTPSWGIGCAWDVGFCARPVCMPRCMPRPGNGGRRGAPADNSCGPKRAHVQLSTVVPAVQVWRGLQGQ